PAAGRVFWRVEWPGPLGGRDGASAQGSPAAGWPGADRSRHGRRWADGRAVYGLRPPGTGALTPFGHAHQAWPMTNGGGSPVIAAVARTARLRRRLHPPPESVLLQRPTSVSTCLTPAAVGLSRVGWRQVHAA